MKMSLRLTGALLVTYAVSATVALVAWGISYGANGVPVFHDGRMLAITGVISVVAATVVGIALLGGFDEW